MVLLVVDTKVIEAKRTKRESRAREVGCCCGYLGADS